MGSRNSRDLGWNPGVAAHREGRWKLWQSLWKLALLRNFFGTDFLHSHNRRIIFAAVEATRRRASIQGVWLSSCAQSLHCRSSGDSFGTFHLSNGDDLARIVDRD